MFPGLLAADATTIQTGLKQQVAWNPARGVVSFGNVSCCEEPDLFISQKTWNAVKIP
jgi:hypothetical protein